MNVVVINIGGYQFELTPEQALELMDEIERALDFDLFEETIH